MELADHFIPTAGAVGIVPMITYFGLLVTTYAFLGYAVFALTTLTAVAPAHRPGHSLTAIIALLAGVSYFLIQGFYHQLLTELAAIPDPGDRQTLIRESFSAINQYRYVDWAVTTPLLLVQMVLMLRIPTADLKRPLAMMLLADMFMILTGYIGDQQLGFDNEVVAGAKLVWGAVSTIGYVVIPFLLYRLWKQFANRTTPPERGAYRLMALTTVTFWGVYPIGYILTVIDMDHNWIHMAFCVADLVNKVGVGLVAFRATRLATERVPS